MWKKKKRKKKGHSEKSYIKPLYCMNRVVYKIIMSILMTCSTLTLINAHKSDIGQNICVILITKLSVTYVSSMKSVESRHFFFHSISIFKNTIKKQILNRYVNSSNINLFVISFWLPSLPLSRDLCAFL